VYQDGGLSYLLELNDGSGLPPATAVGMAAGGRVGLTVAGDGERGRFVVGPGLDLWAASPGREVVVAPTVDFNLRHDLWTGWKWDLDLNLGTGYFCGRAADFGFPRVFPVVGLSTGFRF
jgi:hypothetical protein